MIDANEFFEKYFNNPFKIPDYQIKILSTVLEKEGLHFLRMSRHTYKREVVMASLLAERIPEDEVEWYINIRYHLPGRWEHTFSTGFTILTVSPKNDRMTTGGTYG